MDTKPVIEATKTVFVAWTNTDLTEGRGQVVPLAVSHVKATAIRMGRKGSVMGSDCHVTDQLAVKVSGQWLVPGVIHTPTEADRRAEDRSRVRREALDRAKAAGLSEEDIKALQGAQP